VQILGQSYQVYLGQLLRQVLQYLGYKLSGKGLAIFAGIVMIYISILVNGNHQCKLYLLY
jgi:hypothetical protein